MIIELRNDLANDLIGLGLTHKSAEEFTILIEALNISKDDVKSAGGNLNERAIPFEDGIALSEIIALIFYKYNEDINKPDYEFEGCDQNTIDESGVECESEWQGDHWLCLTHNKTS